MFSRQWRWTTLLVFLAIGVTIRLGIWQIDRNSQRRSQNEHIKAMQSLPALELPYAGDQQDLIEMEYRAVRATGKYDYDHQVVIRNQAWAQDWGIETGYAILTP